MCNSKSEASLVCFVITLGVSVVVLGSITADIWNKHERLVSSSNDCDAWSTAVNATANGTTTVWNGPTELILTKVLSAQWHWTYEFDGGEVQSMCPSVHHDTALYVDGTFTSYVVGKFLSDVTRADVRNCRGEPLFAIDTGGVWQTIVNLNTVFVTMFILDASGQTQLAYLENTHWLGDEMIVYDRTDGHQVATLDRTVSGVRWQWTIRILDVNHPVADMRLLTVLAGKRSFSDTDSHGKDQNDVCTGFFVVNSILVIVLVSVLVVALCFFLVYACSIARDRIAEEVQNAQNRRRAPVIEHRTIQTIPKTNQGFVELSME